MLKEELLNTLYDDTDITLLAVNSIKSLADEIMLNTKEGETPKFPSALAVEILKLQELRGIRDELQAVYNAVDNLKE